MRHTIRALLSAACVIASSAAYAQVISGSEANAQSGANAGAQAAGNITTFNSTSRSVNKRQAPTAIAPGLAASAVETCLGSASGGVAGPGFGISFGGTKEDESCDIRLTARSLYAMGHKNAATAVMCQHDRVARAMAMIGTPCPGYPGYVETVPPNTPMARAAGYAPALGYAPRNPDIAVVATQRRADVSQADRMVATFNDSEFFFDKKGRRFVIDPTPYKNAREAKRAGATQSASGEWVRLAQ